MLSQNGGISPWPQPGGSRRPRQAQPLTVKWAMAGLFLSFAAAAYAVAVFLATRFIVGRAFPRHARPWMWIPVAAVLTVIPSAARKRLVQASPH